MKRRYIFASGLLGLFSAFAISCVQDTVAAQQVAKAKIFNALSQIDKPYVVMISIDGYRHDYTKKYQPPNLSELANKGVQAVSLKPSFPTLTFPNHYTLVTGLRPARHGIVGNFFYDQTQDKNYAMNDNKAVNNGSWYGGTPLWRAVSMQGMLSATLYWVGSEAAIAGGQADYVQPWTPPLDHQARVDQVIRWLSLPVEERPHFLTLYFSAVDSAGHASSPDSNEVKNAIMDIDAVLGKLRKFAKTSNPPVNLVVVSDHGMQTLNPSSYIPLYEKVDLSGFKVQERGAITQLYSNDQVLVEQTLVKINEIPHLHAYRRADVPEKFQYRNNSRIGDILVVADAPFYIQSKAKEAQPMTSSEKLDGKVAGSRGTHGWDPDEMDMHGIFYAEGPQFQQSTVIPTVDNVHIYPMILELLGLPLIASDGDPTVLRKILRN